MASIKLIQLPEPLIGFGYQQRMEHPKDGLFLFGPLADDTHPTEMRIGVIGENTGNKKGHSPVGTPGLKWGQSC